MSENADFVGRGSENGSDSERYASNKKLNDFPQSINKSPSKRFNNISTLHKMSSVGPKIQVEEDVEIDSDNKKGQGFKKDDPQWIEDQAGFHIHDLIVDQDPATHFLKLPKLKKMLVKDENVEFGQQDNAQSDSDEEKKAILEKEKDDFVKSADFNKELYIREYGVQFSIPTSFVLNSHFFGNGSLYFQVIKRIYPKVMEFNQKSLIVDLKPKPNVQERMTEIVLKWMKIEDGNQIYMKEEKLLPGSSFLSCFSPNGKKFAYLVANKKEKKHTIVVHVANDLKNPGSLLKNKYVVEVPDQDERGYIRDDSNVKFMDIGNKKAAMKQLFDNPAGSNQADSEVDAPVLKFSEDETMLIGYRGTRFFRVDYKYAASQKTTPRVEQIDEKVYKSILQLNYFASMEENEQQEQIYIAAKVLGRYQIRMFEYITEKEYMIHQQRHTQGNYKRYKMEKISTGQIVKKIRKKDLYERRKETKTQRVINYDSDPNDPLPKIFLSRDFHIDRDKDNQSINKFQHNQHIREGRPITNYVLFSSLKENYLLHFHEGGTFTKQRIPLMKSKYIVHHVQEDIDSEGNGGFYIICSRPEDWRIRVIHTHRQYLLIKLPAVVENSFLKVFQLQWNDNTGDQFRIDRLIQSNMNVLCLDHNDCVLFQTQYFEEKEEKQAKNDDEDKIEDHELHKAKVVINPLNDQNSEVLCTGYNALGNTHEEAAKTLKISLGSTKAFHMCWPRISYADQQSDLYVANLYDGGHLSQIKLDFEDKDQAHQMTICCTYLTPQQNLYILAHQGDTYMLFRKVLVDKKEDDDFDPNEYIKKPLLVYDQSNMNKGLVTEVDDKEELIKVYSSTGMYFFTHPSMMFVRDEDQADDNGTLDSLYVFILHGMKKNRQDNEIRYTLFQWRQDKHNENGGQNLIVKVDYIKNQKVLIGLDNSLYYVTEEFEEVPWEDRIRQAHEVLGVTDKDSLNSITQKYQQQQDKFNRDDRIFKTDFEQKRARKLWMKIRDAYKLIEQDRNKHHREQQEHTYEIKNLVIGHMKTFKRTSYKEFLKADELLSFDLDQEAEKIILLYRVRKEDTINKSHSIKRGDYHIKIFDIKQNKILIGTKIRDHLLIKLLISGKFEITGGHIYHSNSVVKIRYDLLEEYRDASNTKIKSLNEKALFDYYSDLMLLPKGRQISNLLFSPLNKRMCFLIEDQVNLEEPSILRITPYLHDRKIVLDVPTQSNKYQNYMTSLRVNRKDLIEGMLKNNPRSLGQSMKDPVGKSKISVDEMSFIVRINFSEQMMQVYSQNGVRVHTWHINDDFLASYGEAVAISNSGNYIVMKQPLKLLIEQLKNTPSYEDQAYAPKELTTEFFKINIIKVTQFELLFIKTVDVKAQIEAFLRDTLIEEDLIGKFKENNKWIFSDNVDDFLRKIEMAIHISDNADILVKLQVNNITDQKIDTNPESTFRQKLATVRTPQFFYIMKNEKVDAWRNINSVKKIDYAVSHQGYREKLYWVETDLCKSDAEKEDAEGKVDSETVDEIRRAFYILDEDGNNYLNKEEIKRLLMDMFDTVNDQQADAIMSLIDKNDDGCISFEEFRDAGVKAKGFLNQDNLKLYRPQQFKIDFNDKYMIFFSNQKIHHVDLKSMMSPDNLYYESPIQIDLKLNKPDSRGIPYIQRVHPSPDPEKVAIVIETDQDKCIVLDWNLGQGYEYNHHEVKMPFFITFDYKRPKLMDHKEKLKESADSEHNEVDKQDPFHSDQECYTVIVTGEYTSISELFCDLTVFQPNIEDIKGLSMRQKMHFGTDPANDTLDGSVVPAKGLRFDGYNFNWILFDNYLAIPFCYMSFMIKDKIEKIDNDINENQFDIDAYNYMFNRSTSFMDGEFTRSDTDSLLNALQQLWFKSERNLGIIKFSTYNPFYDENSKNKSNIPFTALRRRSALSIALTNKNATGVNVILEFMSMTSQDASECYFELYKNLIDYDSFKCYLESLTVETNEMKRTKTFKKFKKTFEDELHLNALAGFFKKLFVYGDWNSPLYSNMGDLILQSKSTNTIILSKQFYEGELYKRTPNDKNYEYMKENFHDYPCRVQSVRCGWMFNQTTQSGFIAQKDHLIENSNLIFLKDILDSDNTEFFEIPYIQIITQYFFEKVLIEQQDFAQLFYLIADTLLILVQFSLLMIQMFTVNIDRDKTTLDAEAHKNIKDWRFNVTLINRDPEEIKAWYYKDYRLINYTKCKENPKIPSQASRSNTEVCNDINFFRKPSNYEWNQYIQQGVNPNSYVTFIGVGNFANWQVFLAGIQVVLIFWGFISSLKKSISSSCGNITKIMSYQIIDTSIKVLVLLLVYYRFENISYRYRVFQTQSGTVYNRTIDGVINKTNPLLDKKAPHNLVMDRDFLGQLEGTIGNDRRKDCQGIFKDSCQMMADITFQKYTFEMSFLIISIFVNLLTTIFKFIYRFGVFFINMAKFMDLIGAMLRQLAPFVVFTMIFWIFSSIIFYSLGQYQIKVDYQYAFVKEVKGDTPHFTLASQTDSAYGDAVDNMEEDYQEAILYRFLHGSMLYVFQMLLGEADPTAFNIFKRGIKSPATFLLYAIFIFTSAIMMILLLNVIIAIMGQVQEDSTNEGRKVETRFRLRTALEYWHQVRANIDGAGGSMLSKFIYKQVEQKPNKFMVGVTSISVEEESGKKTVELNHFNEQLKYVCDKLETQNVDLFDVKNEINKLKVVAKNNFKS